MIRNTYFLSRAVKIIIFLNTFILWQAPIVTSLVNAAETQSATLLHKENLIYEGSFKMPKGDHGGSRFDWAGTALAYHPLNNSLFVVGHDHQQMVAEVTIPTPVVTSNEDSLPIATVLQPFADITEGKMYTVDSSKVNMGGLLSYNNKLYGAVYSYYDANNSTTLSHFSSSLNLSTQGDADGMYKLGDKAGFVSGYMSPIPPEWQSAFGGPAITGNCCIPIISRSSFGPSAYVFEPTDIGKQSPVPATPIVNYPEDYALDLWNSTGNKFNGTTKIRGVVFPNNSRSVLFFGTQGIGEFCYGTGEDCNDPTKASKGNHAYPYVNQVWAYDALDLLKAKDGTIPPWDVKPYQIWQFDMPFETTVINKQPGAAYDPSTKRIFVTHYRGGAPFIVHVYKLNHDTTEADNIPPATPQGFLVD